MKAIWIERLLLIGLWSVYLFFRLNNVNLMQEILADTSSLPLVFPQTTIFWVILDIICISLTLIIITIPFKQQQIKINYQQYIQPKNIQLMTLLAICYILLSRELFLVNLFITALLYNCSLKTIQYTSAISFIRNDYLLKYSLGLIFGCINILLLLSFSGFIGHLPSTTWDIVFTIFILGALIALGVFNYVKYGNEAIMIPSILYFIGLVIRWYPSDINMVWISIICLFITVGLYLYIFNLQQKEKIINNK